MLDPKKTFDDAHRRAWRPTRARATRCSPTRSTSSSRARWPARRSSPRSPSSTSSTAAGALRPAGARHAAVAQRAGLPRRAGPADGLPHRAARSGCSCGRGGCSARARGSCSRAAQGDGGRAARRPVDVLPRAGRDGARARRARDARQGAARRSPTTTFLLVTSLEREPVDETSTSSSGCASRSCRSARAVVNKVREPVTDDAPRLPGSRPGWRGGSRSRRARRRRWPRATPTNLERLRAALDDPPVVAVPLAPGRRPRPRRPRARARGAVRLRLAGGRLLRRRWAGREHLVGEAAQVRVQVAAQDVAQHRAQAAGERADQRLDLRVRPQQAGDRAALERDGALRGAPSSPAGPR